MTQTGGDVRSGIGARLRAGRERMGLTQLQAAEKLHVDPKVVESLEAEQFEALGAPVFVRGHLKRYCELVGENAQQLTGLYSAATQPALPDLTRVPKAAPEARPGRMAVPALVILIAFVGLGLVWWVIESVDTQVERVPPPDAREVSVDPLSEEFGDTLAPEESLSGDVDGNGEPASAASAGVISTVPASSPAPATAASARGSGPTGTLVPSQPSSSPTAAGAVAATPADASGPMAITLRFAADSWVEVYDANGTRLFYDIGAANSQRTLSGPPPLRVRFGNAPGVSFDVNGKPATLPDTVVRNETAHFVINRSGRIVRAQPQAPVNPEGN